MVAAGGRGAAAVRGLQKSGRAAAAAQKAKAVAVTTTIYELMRVALLSGCGDYRPLH